jgi:nitrate/TMAO reductase-like tetraheme cytochrome c subunit
MTQHDPGLKDIEVISTSDNGKGKKELVDIGRPKRRRPLVIDLRQPKHRRILILGIIGFGIFGLAFTIGGYEVYTYTESSEFCGTVCHTMKPQFARYNQSVHMNVECVECHVGPGADHYIKSKIAGMRQLYGILTNTYQRPIKSPVHDLRPARETCENCHTPTFFKDNIVKTIEHFDNDEHNTPVTSTLILKMGGWQEYSGMSQGIHWHISNPVYYIAADDQRQAMLWVGVEQNDGSLKEFFSRDMLLMAQTSFVEEARTNGEVRQMDCIDCHNRAAHDIPAPERLIDEAIQSGLISASIPYIRAESVRILKRKFDTRNEAINAIDALKDKYQSNYPTIVDSQPILIENAINTLEQIYSSTNFPEMNLDWETNPNNESHSNSLGCFRCHDDKHVSLDQNGQEREMISGSCKLCHTVPIVGRGKDLVVESPVIVGAAPQTHSSFRWTIEHQSISEAEKQDCFLCHGQGFCNNGACHNLEHPPDMIYTHPQEYRNQGDQVCYTCHQDIQCSRCHVGGIISNP